MAEHLSRSAISDAVLDLGWRLVLNRLSTAVAVDAMTDATTLAGAIVAATDGSAALRLDLRPRAVLVAIEPETGWPTGADIELARSITNAVTTAGARTDIALTAQLGRDVQTVEFAVDAMDIDAIRPFWRAVMGYVEAPDGSLVDPAGQGFAVWFQQMDTPRTERNRIHFDVVVPHDIAAARIEATLAAGGTLVSDAAAPAFWILADIDGNEVCVCTWQGRDSPD